MDERQVQAQIVAHNERNKALLKAIASHGASLEEKRPTDHTFYAKREADAAVLSQDLKSLNFEKVEQKSAGSFFSRKYTIEAVINASPNEVTDEAFVEKLVRAAALRNSVYDGWGMALS